MSAAIGLAYFWIYLLMAPPVSGDKDGSEFTLVLATNGVAHPTGYPLFTLFGHGFVRIAHALGASWPLAANAWSALGGGVAMAFFHALAVRLGLLATGSPPAVAWMIGSAVLFGLDPMWTQETTLAEVYSWHVAWALGASLFFAGFVRRFDPGERESERGLRLRAAVWGVLCGVGAAHHLTSAFVIMPLSAGLVVAAARSGRWRWSLGVVALASSLIPLSSYGIVAWRAFHPVPVQWPVLAPTWQGVREHVTGGQYAQLLGHFAPSQVQRIYLARYVYPYLALGFVAMLALAWSARGRAAVVLRSLAGAALLSTTHAFAYGAFDPSSYFLPGLAIGLCCLGPFGSRVSTRVRLPRGLTAAMLVLATCVQLVPWTRASVERRQVYGRFERLVHSMWASIPFTNGIVVWADDMYVRLRQYQILDGEKPGLVVLNPFLLTYSEPRRRFTSELGFDPLSGIDDRVAPLAARLQAFGPERDSLIQEARELIVHNINRQTSLPVVDFVPESTSVRLLVKPRGGGAGR